MKDYGLEYSLIYLKMRGYSGCFLSNYYDFMLNLKIKVVYFVLTVRKRTGLESLQHKEEKFSLRE